MKIRVIQGPNINLLGLRDPAMYGVMTMEQIHENMKLVCDQAGIEIEFFQSNMTRFFRLSKSGDWKCGRITKQFRKRWRVTGLRRSRRNI